MIHLFSLFHDLHLLFKGLSTRYFLLSTRDIKSVFKGNILQISRVYCEIKQLENKQLQRVFQIQQAKLSFNVTNNCSYSPDRLMITQILSDRRITRNISFATQSRELAGVFDGWCLETASVIAPSITSSWTAATASATTARAIVPLSLRRLQEFIDADRLQQQINMHQISLVNKSWA